MKNDVVTAVIGMALIGTSLGASNDIFVKSNPDIETRWYTYENPEGLKGQAAQSNFGRKGAPCAGVGPGKTLVLADIEGSGTIRRIWCTCDPVDDPEVLRGIKLEIYWDDAELPAVQAPLGDFFGHSLGKMCKFENEFFHSPEAKSHNCYIPMPFRKNARVQFVNESDKWVTFFYEVDATIGDQHPDGMMYFHTFWNRENYNDLREDFTILPKVEGDGRWLGCNIGLRQNPTMNMFWWGEGEVKVYLDGDTEWPTLAGTGTEDYVGSGWGQQYFIGRYQGCQYDVWPNIGFYRLHVPDPVFFKEDIRVTIQAIGCTKKSPMLKEMKKHNVEQFMAKGDGKEFFTQENLAEGEDTFIFLERQDDYCATSYWYMRSPTNTLGKLAPVELRTADLPEHKKAGASEAGGEWDTEDK